jgi:hypothetical protein
VLAPTATVLGVPDQCGGVTWVVSRLVAEALGPRGDVVYPVDQIRNRFGRVVGCRALGMIAAAEVAGATER